MNDSKVLNKSEKFIMDLYIIGLYRETVESLQHSADDIINDIDLDRKKSILLLVTQTIYPYIKLKYNYSIAKIDKYIDNEYPTLLIPNYFNNTIINFINTSTYDSSNDKPIKKLFSTITNNIYNDLNGGEIKPIRVDIYNTIKNFKNVDDDCYTETIYMLIDNPSYTQQLSELISVSFVFYRKLNSKFNNNTVNLDMYSISIYPVIKKFILTLDEFDKYYEHSYDDEVFSNSYFSETIFFLLYIITKRLKEYDKHNNLPIIF